MPDKAQEIGQGAALGVALLLRVALALQNSGLTMDSGLYVRMAEDLLAGTRGPSPAHHGYPLLLLLASRLLPGRELPGRVVSCLAALAYRSFWQRPPTDFAVASRTPDSGGDVVAVTEIIEERIG